MKLLHVTTGLALFAALACDSSPSKQGALDAQAEATSSGRPADSTTSVDAQVGPGGGNSQDADASNGAAQPGAADAAVGQELDGALGLDSGTTGDGVTWHQHIAPLVLQKCGGCHVSGGIAPFSLQNYDEARQWASAMAAAIDSGSMPPWGAEETDECTPPGTFRDDIRLTEAERTLFGRWVQSGRLEGSVLDAAPIPEPPVLTLPNPTRQLTIPSAVTVDGTSDRFVCFTLDPDITENVWLTGAQVVAGNAAIAHHALVFLDRAGQGELLADENGQYDCFGSPGLDDTSLIAAWAPGANPELLPPETGIPLKPGQKLVVQMHYHPTGSGPEVDAETRIDLAWVNEKPNYIGGVYLIGNFDQENPSWAGGEGYGLTTGPDFLIPAGATDHQEINRYRLDDNGRAIARLMPLYVWMVGTHMHYVGKDMKITATSPDGEDQCLLQTPHWDFNWQRGYLFNGAVEQLPVVHPGDSLTMRCTYDNSLGNPFVREALNAQGMTEPRDVALGEGTLDEMCLGVFGFAVDKMYAADVGLE